MLKYQNSTNKSAVLTFRFKTKKENDFDFVKLDFGDNPFEEPEISKRFNLQRLHVIIAQYQRLYLMSGDYHRCLLSHKIYWKITISWSICPNKNYYNNNSNGNYWLLTHERVAALHVCRPHDLVVKTSLQFRVPICLKVTGQVKVILTKVMQIIQVYFIYH